MDSSWINDPFTHAPAGLELLKHLNGIRSKYREMVHIFRNTGHAPSLASKQERLKGHKRNFPFSLVGKIRCILGSLPNNQVGMLLLPRGLVSD